MRRTAHTSSSSYCGARWVRFDRREIFPAWSSHTIRLLTANPYKTCTSTASPCSSAGPTVSASKPTACSRITASSRSGVQPWIPFRFWISPKTLATPILPLLSSSSHPLHLWLPLTSALIGIPGSMWRRERPRFHQPPTSLNPGWLARHRRNRSENPAGAVRSSTNLTLLV